MRTILSYYLGMNLPRAPLHPGKSPAQPVSGLGGEHVSAQRIQRISSTDLLGAQRELEIVHGEELYRLRLTSSGKLILTK